LACKPAPIESAVPQSETESGLYEVETVKEFATAMEKRGIAEWWKKAMDFH